MSCHIIDREGTSHRAVYVMQHDDVYDTWDETLDMVAKGSGWNVKRDDF